MKNILLLSLLSLPLVSYAENKLSVDLNITDLNFQKPPKGVGKAGNLIFKSANVNNNGIILNINNVNNYFDSQIFIRPTFLGFTTQFGNYGVTLEDDGLFTDINTIQLQNSKVILDDIQLNVGGEYLKFVNSDSNVKLNFFRLYCQSPATESSDAPTPDLVKNCLSYLTLNGSYNATNTFAALEYTGLNKINGDKTYIKSKVKNVDIRQSKLSIRLGETETVSNDSYIIKANEVSLDCAKDPLLTEFNTDKIQKDCLNNIKIAPLKASLVDNVAKSKFELDVKDITIRDKIVYLTLPKGALSDQVSTTFINDLLLNCKKDTDTDVFELTQVLRDCISYARISIGEVYSTKPDESKGSSIKKIAISSASSAMVIQADVSFLGIKSRVSINGKVALNEAKKQLNLTVTETRLPFGLTSVKLLMYFLKKNLISKDISYSNNNITISL